MSNIFYSNVDPNLQEELNARGLAGKTNRSTEALNFMLGKIANVRLTAYAGSNALTEVANGRWAVLGGETVREKEFLPDGPLGFLTDRSVTTSNIVISGDAAVLKEDVAINTLKRVGPFITAVDVTVGDHSLGLLNKATISITIPNPDADLEDVESIWFYPGRYAKIEIQYPDSAVITGLSLTDRTLPNREALAERYKDQGITVNEIIDQINDINRFRFEGLVTSFDFSYNESGQVDATLSLTGTSNVFTDVSMFLNPNAADKKNTINDVDFEVNREGAGPLTQQQAAAMQPAPNSLLFAETPTSPVTGSSPTFTTVTTLYKTINEKVKTRVGTYDPDSAKIGIIPYNPISIDATGKKIPTDQFILFGRPYDATTNDPAVDKYILEEAARVQQLNTGSAEFQSAFTASANFSASLSISNSYETSQNFYHKYITLGALIQEVNSLITKKLSNSVSFPHIICDDIICFSNYLEKLTSCIPDEILLLPENTTNPNDMNGYSSLTYYAFVENIKPITETTEQTIKYPGIYEVRKDGNNKIFTSRIFINIKTIETILDSLSEKNTKNFSLKNFLAAISSKIEYATAGSIKLQLMSLPDDPRKLAFIDVKCIKTNTKGNVQEKVNAYPVPMFANNKFGTIVQSFSFQANLPENAKNLSYVLNSGEEVSDDEIAPYLNFMYNSKDINAVNKFIQRYKAKHEKVLTELEAAKQQLSLAPRQPQLIGALWKALSNYIKFPSADIKKSQQLTAPIFPFTVNFTIDGVNGFRYGDVLTFDGLPLRYRAHTVFSITSITHNVSTDGKWTTDINCIMRPNIE